MLAFHRMISTSTTPDLFMALRCHGYKPMRTLSEVLDVVSLGAPRAILGSDTFNKRVVPSHIGDTKSSNNPKSQDQIIWTEDLDKYVQWGLGPEVSTGTCVLVMHDPSWFGSEEVQTKLLRMAIRDMSQVWREAVYKRDWRDRKEPVERVLQTTTEVYETIQVTLQKASDQCQLTGVLSQGLVRMNEHYMLIGLEHLHMLCRETGMLENGVPVVNNVRATMEAGGVQYVTMIEEGVLASNFSWDILKRFNLPAKESMFSKVNASSLLQTEEKTASFGERQNSLSCRDNRCKLVNFWRRSQLMNRISRWVRSGRSSNVLRWRSYCKELHVNQMYDAYLQAVATVVAVPAISPHNDLLDSLILSGWFSSAWTLLDLALARKVVLSTPSGNVPMFDVIIDRMAKEIRLLFEKPEHKLNNRSVSYDTLFRAVYSYRNSRLALIKAFPQQDVMLLMEGRDSVIEADKVFVLAKISGITLQYDPHLTLAEAWAKYIKLAQVQSKSRPVFFTSGLVEGKRIGESAVPDIGSEARVFWPNRRVMNILGFTPERGVQVDTYQLLLHDPVIKVTTKLSWKNRDIETIVAPQWDALCKLDDSDSVSQEMQTRSRADFMSMAEYANSLLNPRGRFMKEQRHGHWVSGTVAAGWFTGFVTENAVSELAHASWMVECLNNT
ncbi:hypothetical protein HK100_007309, partial [Physocladia obscura]